MSGIIETTKATIERMRGGFSGLPEEWRKACIRQAEVMEQAAAAGQAVANTAKAAKLWREAAG